MGEIRHTERFAEIERIFGDYFNSHLAPVMRDTQRYLNSKQVEEIRQAILAQVDRGVTMLYGEGGYKQEQKQIVLSIVSNRELPQVEKLIRQIDPEAFMIISRVTEVRGRGFSLSKHYGEEEG